MCVLGSPLLFLFTVPLIDFLRFAIGGLFLTWRQRMAHQDPVWETSGQISYIEVLHNVLQNSSPPGSLSSDMQLLLIKFTAMHLDYYFISFLESRPENCQLLTGYLDICILFKTNLSRSAHVEWARRILSFLSHVSRLQFKILMVFH